MFSSVKKTYEQYKRRKQLQPEGRYQKKLMQTIYFEQCSNVYVLESELKKELKSSKWFRNSTHMDDPYLQPVLDEKGNEVESYIGMMDAFAKVAQILEWDQAKQSQVLDKNPPPFKTLCFNCPSTQVDTKEYTKKILDSGVFGSAVDPNIIPERLTVKPFVSNDLFVNGEPDRIAWIQMQELFYEHDDFVLFQQKVDQMFLKLQKEAQASASKGQRGKIPDVLKENQIFATEVPFQSFIKKFSSKFCKLDLKNPENSHPFWSTETGKEWQQMYEKILSDQETPSDGTTSDTTVTVEPKINWASVYNGILELYPKVQTLEELRERQNPTKIIPNEGGIVSAVTDEISSQTTSMFETLQKHYSNFIPSTQTSDAIDPKVLSVEQQTMLQQLQSIENTIAKQVAQSTQQIQTTTENIFQQSKQILPQIKNDIENCIRNSSLPSLDVQRFLSVAQRPRAQIKRYV